MREWMRWMMVGVAAAALTACAQASSITAGTYDLNDVAVDGYGLNGTVTFSDTGLVTAAYVTLEDSALGDPVFTQVNSTGGPAGSAPAADYAYVTAPGVGQLSIQYLPALDSSGNVDLCILSASDCNSYQASYMQIYESSSLGYGQLDLSGGTLDAAETSSTTPSAPTPEPGSLALLGTGVLGLAAFAPRRFFRR